MIEHLNELKNLLKESKNILIKNFDDEKYSLDHAAYITSDKSHYDSTIETFSENLELLGEVSRSGRRIAVYNLKESIEESGLVLNKVVVLEPKPDREIEKSKWEHISFRVDNLEKLIQKYKGTEQEFKKIRQIGDDKFAYFETTNFGIQFRNNEFMPTQSDSSKNDFEKMYNEEREKRLIALADIENEKKRLEKHKEEFVKMANASLINDLLEIVDDLSRAVANNTEDESLKMIYNKTLGLLNNYGVIPVDIKIGDKFDPITMEALTTTPVTEKEKDGTIVHIDQIGFKTKEDDQIIRNSRVIVGKAN